MPRFVAFLRGINVGSHRVKKEKLLEVFTSLGFKNVRTFKQSGNVIFETSATNVERIKTGIEEKLFSLLGYQVAVLLRTIQQLQNMVESEQFQTQNNEGTSFLVTLLPTAPPTFPLQLPLTIPKSTAEVTTFIGTEVFSVTHGGGEGALPNPFIESRLKVKATTRNLKTIREIVSKYSD